MVTVCVRMAESMTSTTSERVDATDADSAAHASPARRAVRSAMSVRFIACVSILFVSAVSMQTVARFFGQYFRKRPVPLKRALAALDKSKLAPKFGLHIRPVMPISDEMLQAMGTEEYAQLRLVDVTMNPSDPASVAHLFVTYYTGQPDLVPHVPDECYQAGGYDLLKARNTQLKVPGVGADDDMLPVRVLTFDIPNRGLRSSINDSAESRLYVIYFFLTNGEYVTTRTQVRIHTADLRDRYAYYAKFEVKFSNYSFGKVAGESESLAAMAKLMRTVLPIMLKDHFVDWDKLKSGDEG